MAHRLRLLLLSTRIAVIARIRPPYAITGAGATDIRALNAKRYSSASSQAEKLLDADLEADDQVLEQYPLTSAVARTILRERFGHGSFRPYQEEVIARLLHGGSAIAIFPTGAGKSLIFQVAALAFGEGVTVVVAPLVALIKDQVQALLRLGISAAAIDSTMAPDDVHRVFDRVRRDEVRLLYVAPERLSNAAFAGLMAGEGGEGRVRVRMLAVDEAHCVYEWGNTFRPEYLRLARFVKECKAERVLCVTATATPEVTHRISRAFGIPADGVFRTGIYRPNLRLLAQSFSRNGDRFDSLVEFLRQHRGPGIVYVLKRSLAETLAEQLVGEGFEALPYHAGLDKEVRSATQDHFMAGKDVVVVATIAFGLGINKPDIRKIVHYGPPLSLENYAQEIGRAGRDGLPSKCIILTSPIDIPTHDFLTLSPPGGLAPTKAGVRRVVRHLLSALCTPPGEAVIVPLHAYGKLLLGTYIERGKPAKKRKERKKKEKKQVVVEGEEEEKKKRSLPRTLRLNADSAAAAEALLVRFEVGIGAGYVRALPTAYGVVTYHGLPALEALAAKGEDDLAASVVAASVPSEVDDMWMFNLRGVGASREAVLRQMQVWEHEGLVDVECLGVALRYELVREPPGGREGVREVVGGLWSGVVESAKRGAERRDAVKALVEGKAGCFVGVLEKHFGEVGGEVGAGRECGSCQWCLDRRRGQRGGRGECGDE